MIARRLAIGLALIATWQLAAAAYIPAKAVLAQVLLARAWRQAAAHGGTPRPWPWADTWPVARLAAPSRGVDLVVLSGGNGAALPFAPGHVDGTALPGAPGNSVVAGHRDTHFRFLRDLAVGDPIVVQRPGGPEVRLAVTGTRVFDVRDAPALASASGPVLVLVTCYPFDALRPGGPLRYVVFAAPEDAAEPPGNHPPAGLAGSSVGR